MADIQVTIEGLEGLIKRLAKAKAQKHITAAMRKGTLLVERGAKMKAPVDTGRLRSSITSEVRGVGADTVGVVGSNVVYAPYQEFGTRKMPAHPYLRPALAEAKDKILDFFREAMDKLAKEIAK